MDIITNMLSLLYRPSKDHMPISILHSLFFSFSSVNCVFGCMLLSYFNMLSEFVFLLLDTYSPSSTHLIQMPFGSKELIIFCILVSMCCKNISAIMLDHGAVSYTHLQKKIAKDF